MSREEVERLLGGYATGSLSGDERRRLFAAALADQEVFEALAREQEFRDLLEEPGAREELLAALEREPVPQTAAAAAPSRPAPAPDGGGVWEWLRQPWPWAVAATAALTAVLFFALRPPPREPVETVAVRQERTEPAPPDRAGESAGRRAGPSEPKEATALPPALRRAEGSQAAAPPDAPAASEAKAGEERAKADRRPPEAERMEPLPVAPAIAPAQPRKAVPPGAPPAAAPLRDEIARAAGAAAPPAPQRANELRAPLTYRLGTPAFQPGQAIQLYVTAVQAGVVAVTRRTAEGWSEVASIRLEADKETRVLVPTGGSGGAVELELSFEAGRGRGEFAGSSGPPYRVRVVVPRAD